MEYSGVFVLVMVSVLSVAVLLAMAICICKKTKSHPLMYHVQLVEEDEV